VKPRAVFTASDHGLAELFGSDPDLINLFTGSTEPVLYQMKSEVLKHVERRLDAAFYPVEEHLPIVYTEFQAYQDAAFYYRSLAGGGLLGERHPSRQIQILLIFIKESFDPKTEPWHHLGRSGFSDARQNARMLSIRASTQKRLFSKK